MNSSELSLYLDPKNSSDAGESFFDRNEPINSFVSDLKDIPSGTGSPKTIIYVIVITMIAVLLLVLYLMWMFNFMDEKERKKRDFNANEI